MREVPRAEPIIIESVLKGRHINHKILMGCYFYPAGNDKFTLYSSSNVPLAWNLQTGLEFGFALGPFQWTVTDFVISRELASGIWKAVGPGPMTQSHPEEGEDEGTFQAQAGGHTLESVASAAAR